jgi:AraC-like DNA-binding protein
MAGFKSAAHFSRMFKSEYGMTPKEYRTSQLGNACAALSTNTDIAA